MDWKSLQYQKPEKIKQLQNKILRRFMQEQMPFHPYYSNYFRKNKLSIKTTDDLMQLAFTTKEDLLPTAKHPRRFMDFVLAPNKSLFRKHASVNKKLMALLRKKSIMLEYKPIHIHFTTGRSANSVPVFYTAYDVRRLEDAGKRMMNILGINDSDIAVNAFPYAPHLAFWQTFYAIKASNLIGLQTGGGKILGTEKIMQSIQNMNATCIAGMPGYLYHLLRTAAQKKRNFGNLKTIVFGGERIPSGLIEKIKSLAQKTKSNGIKVLSTYAFTEGKVAWGQCSENSGYHLYPDFEFIEVVDKNGERVDEGEKGEVVYTSLDWRGTVLLRYKTGDITCGIYYDKCSHCKRTVPRLDARIERSSDYKSIRLTKIKGNLVNLNLFFPLMSSHKDIEEWQIEIRKRNNDPYEIDELVIYIAAKKAANFENLKKELQERIFSETELKPDIVKMDLKELLERLGMETELKEKRIIDKRK